MASAVASTMPSPPPPAVSFGWLAPTRVSPPPALPAVAVAAEQAVSKEFIDFEFSLGGSATMLPADELFADGKLLPLRPHPVAAEKAVAMEAEKAVPELVKAVRPAVAVAAEVFDPYVFSPKAPTCSSRWRELLRLKKVQTPTKPSASTSASPSTATDGDAVEILELLRRPGRSSRLLLQRNGGRASDSEASLSLASSRFSLSSSSSSSCHEHDDFPRHSLDSVDPTPRPRLRLVRSQPQPHPPAAAAAAAAAVAKPRAAIQSPARRRPSPPPPPPPQVASVDSPRMNSSGKIVFQGLERSSSSPAGSVHSSLRSRSRVMDRSYSAGVRAATPVVLNVPVCSRPVFGFFKDRKDAAAKDSSASRPRSALGRKTAPHAGNGGGASRDLGTSN
ncbi:hypothetical protein OsJ_05513 [Oryza sativa Japonica Group]|uniref:Uncharacterized protein n=1 Tax=Oryza sativa subsp. japonica TaxID=39947 RepID=B9F378_ORYSJ|nr:hypothetical protein OsJ_05513 [Oryza sativa Japonica Group]